jgi:hypothetical protein
VQTLSYKQRRGLAWPLGRVAVDAREARTLGGASLLVGVTALALWLAGGVRIDEIVRYVAYEFGFVFLPGGLVYRALVPRPGGRLRELVFGWSLGYLLEILAFFFTASSGGRSAFYVYPVVVGVPAALVARRRRVEPSRADASTRSLPVRTIWIGAALCALLLLYAGAVGFTQTPLPRDTASVTYQEDTVFAISLAAEALHHWPVTLPMVAGEPLHYHLFAFMHMAAISQVTGIDLSVVVMRLYEIPLLVLLALQLFLVGRRVGRSSSAGLAVLFVVLFLGELDTSTGTETGRFLFRGLFFYWLLASHSFLLGLILLLPALAILCDLVGGGSAFRRSRTAEWVLFFAFLLGCVGSKSYSLLVVGGALVLFLFWQFWRVRTVNRPALLALGISGGLYVVANILVFDWNSAGAFVRPLRNIRTMGGVEELDTFFGHLWGTSYVPSALGVPYGSFGLLGVPIVGIALLLRYRKLALSREEALFLCLFAAVLPSLVFSSQPGFGQMFLVFFGVVPGAILAACGYTLFWSRNGRRLLRPALSVLVAAAASILVLDLVLNASPRVGLQVTLFWVVVAVGAGAVAASFSRRYALTVGLGVAIVGLLLLDTPVIRVLRSAFGEKQYFSLGAAATAAGLALGAAGLVAGGVYAARGRSSARGLAAAAVGGVLLLGLLDTPLDWFPKLVGNSIDGKAVYDRQYSGLTAGLYHGLTWIRDNTRPDDVLVVSNHSIHPDGRDSKYFYYSAFAERRVVLESWDYTVQTTEHGYFSLPASKTPFPRRLALSDAAFRPANTIAIRTLVRDYGARYLVVDKVHGPARPWLASGARDVFSNGDIDVYAMVGNGAPRSTTCQSEQGAGISVLFGQRRTVDGAESLWRSAKGVGFSGLVIQRRGCHDYAVVLTDLQSLAQAKEFQHEAATVDFHVKLECRTQAPTGGLNAVFGHRRTKRAAQKLAGRLNAVGFLGVDVRQDRCGDWEVDLEGLKTAAQRREVRREARSVGFHIRFEPG